ncbi:hypothetical protein KP78_12590 [Jeotgalibacillus soli]|uniref:Uncharacterized protein n=1 Tax=Jeotgalibacillus soli TaxID=889306 RepID=A0A0C2VZI2_9BACL|nr:hypothetical protein KP78_12590 [Jeotgalibacillus soli]
MDHIHPLIYQSLKRMMNFLSENMFFTQSQPLNRLVSCFYNAPCFVYDEPNKTKGGKKGD